VESKATEQQAEYLQGLRDLIAFLEDRPDLIPEWDDKVFYLPADSAEHLASLIRLVGSGEKFSDAGSVGIKRSFGPHTLMVYAQHGTVGCERIQVGEREVPARPAIKATKEPVYEWRCPPSLLTIGLGEGEA
jgi:hypothetical protein